MIRHAKAFLFVAVIVAIACASAPRILTVVTPYVPVLPLDATNFRWLGAADCDLNGQPVIWIHPALRDDLRPFVLHHEMVHVLQMQTFGGCRRFAERVHSDSMFRLHVEAEAYCDTMQAQRLAHFPLDPTVESIVKQLEEDYGYAFDRDSVVAAMPCR